MNILNFVLCVSLLYGLCVSSARISRWPQPIFDEDKLCELRSNVTTYLERRNARLRTRFELVEIESATQESTAEGDILYKMFTEMHLKRSAYYVNCEVTLLGKSSEDAKPKHEYRMVCGFLYEYPFRTTTEELPA